MMILEINLVTKELQNQLNCMEYNKYVLSYLT